jgi:carboxylesterase
MTPIARALADRGFSVDVPRLPGHGTHQAELAETTYADWRGEVERSIERLQSHTDVIVLAGLSMGGLLVLDVGTDHQGTIGGVAAINAAVLPPKGLQIFGLRALARAGAVVPGFVLGLATNDIAKGGDEKAYSRVSARAALSLVEAMPPVLAGLGGLEIPVVIMHSRVDHSVAPQSSREAFRRIGSADKRLVVLERSYHVATLDYDAELIVAELEGLADRVGRPPEQASAQV